MALMSCWECDNSVSESARTCPHCGAGFAAPPPSRRRFYFYLVLALIGIGMWAWMFSTRDTSRDWEIHAVRAGKDAVKSSMKDPSSVRFGTVWGRRSAEEKVTVCGYVNAKNSFGAYAGEQRFMVSPYVRMDDDSTYFDAEWQSICQ